MSPQPGRGEKEAGVSCGVAQVTWKYRCDLALRETHALLHSSGLGVGGMIGAPSHIQGFTPVFLPGISGVQ